MAGRESPPGSLATLTHARIRAEQGDLSGARKVLRDLLAADPSQEAALALLDEIDGRSDRSGGEDKAEAIPERLEADPANLSASFREALGARPPERRERIARLRNWLETVRRAGKAGRDDA